MKYTIKFTTQFKKDIKAVEKQGKDTSKIFEVIQKLADGEVLEPKYKDHNLTGEYSKTRECHIEPDWLLIYQKYETELILMLIRTGSQSELF